MVTHGLLYIVAGRLNDRFGPRIVVSGCGFFLGLGYVLMSQVNTIWHLYLIYGVVLAIGMSGGYVPLASTVARWFVKRRALMTGAAIAGSGAGTMLVPPVAGWLISNYSWQTSYVVIGITVWIVMVTSALFLKRDPSKMGQLPYGQIEVQDENTKIEIKGHSLKEAFRTKQLWLLAIAYFCFALVLQAIMVHIVPHSTELGISAALAANIFIAIGGLSLIGRVAIGTIADRIGNRSTLVICLILMMATVAWLLIAREMWMLYLFGAFFGLAYGGLVAIQSPLVADLFGLKSHGTIFGAIIFIVTIGAAIGPVMAGGLFDATGNYTIAFLTSVIICAIGLAFAVFLRRGKTS